MNALLVGFNASSSEFLAEHLSSRFDRVLVIYDDADTHENKGKEDLHRLRSGDFSSGNLPNATTALEEASVPFWSEAHIVAMKMLGRQGRDPFSINFEERNAFFCACWRYAQGYLQKNHVSVIIFRTIPHFAFEYILMEVARSLGIRCLSKEDIFPLNASYLIDLHDRQKHLDYMPPSASRAELEATSEQIDSFISKQTDDTQVEHPAYFQENRNAALFNRKLFKLCWDFCVDVAAIILRFNRKKYVSLVHKNRYGTYFNETASELSWRWAKWLARFGAIQNSKAYRKLAPKTPAPGGILIVTNYQPERTTIPDCGVYGDLLTFVDLVVSSIKADEDILFKEHPSCFNFPIEYFYRGYLYRSPRIYRALSEYNSLSFIPEDVPVDAYLKSSHTVIGQSTSVVYQASMLGKKAICFAPTWFAGCSLVHYVQSEEDFRAALAAPHPDKNETKEIWQAYLNGMVPFLFPMTDLRHVAEGTHMSFLNHMFALLDHLSDTA